MSGDTEWLVFGQWQHNIVEPVKIHDRVKTRSQRQEILHSQKLLGLFHAAQRQADQFQLLVGKSWFRFQCSSQCIARIKIEFASCRTTGDCNDELIRRGRFQRRWSEETVFIDRCRNRSVVEYLLAITRIPDVAQIGMEHVGSYPGLILTPRCDKVLLLKLKRIQGTTYFRKGYVTRITKESCGSCADFQQQKNEQQGEKKCRQTE